MAYTRCTFKKHIEGNHALTREYKTTQ